MDSPEVALWRAVVLQQFVDASTACRTRYQRHDQDSARAWLLGNSKMFRIVCAMADLPADKVRSQAQRLASLGWPPRKFNLSEGAAL